MNDKYQAEIDEFIDRFSFYKNKRIVLYGIGRYTATLLEGGSGFHFVGLMDKDPENVGKIFFGLPVIDQDTAEKSADMIIINTAETYWNVIFRRIKGIQIPVFYRNGKRAEEEKSILFENPFRDMSYEELCEQIEKAEYISFDFFDTLFMRSVCNPRDLFQLMEIELHQMWKSENTFTEVREQAKKRIHKNYSLDELYQQMELLSGIPHFVMENIKNAELKLEKEQIFPRETVIAALKSALKWGKKVYIISDMYLPERFYRDILEKFNIVVPVGHILLSNELNAAKSDGSMWKYYSEHILKDNSALHIGDNEKADIKEPLKYGIRTYQIPGAWDMANASSMKEIVLYICNDYDTAVMGCVLKETFQNPYALRNTDGKIQIKNNHEMGYCVFGPVILTFFLWLLQQSKSDSVEKLVFMSRDGYFLKEDFEYVCELAGIYRECCYLGISRQLAMAASIESRQDLMEYAFMPYSGSITELFEDRFGIKNIEELPDWNLKDYLENQLSEIWQYLSETKKNYLQYVKQFGLNDRCAVIDLGYYGNNQKYLNKLLEKHMTGYYFNANVSKKNPNTEFQNMVGCFQNNDDPVGEKSQILKKQIYLESFLTAPYGMIKQVTEDGNFICSKKKKNQKFFLQKKEINQGVKHFLYDYIQKFWKYKLQPDIEFIDQYYGYCFSGALEFAEDIKKSFYNDNAMMNRMESMLFY